MRADTEMDVDDDGSSPSLPLRMSPDTRSTDLAELEAIINNEKELPQRRAAAAEEVARREREQKAAKLEAVLQCNYTRFCACAACMKSENAINAMAEAEDIGANPQAP